jgi:serine/threonine-protein kinase RsbW
MADRMTTRIHAEGSPEAIFKDNFESLAAEPVCIGPTLHLNLTMRSEIAAISPLVDRVMQLIRISRCVLGDECNVEIALREALTNAVLHGNMQDIQKNVYLSCCIRPGKELSIVVRDEGSGFDPSKVPNPTAVENLHCETGRGIFLMNVFMDDVRFERGGTEVHLVKRFKPGLG